MRDLVAKKRHFNEGFANLIPSDESFHQATSSGVEVAERFWKGVFDSETVERVLQLAPQAGRTPVGILDGDYRRPRVGVSSKPRQSGQQIRMHSDRKQQVHAGNYSGKIGLRLVNQLRNVARHPECSADVRCKATVLGPAVRARKVACSAEVREIHHVSYDLLAEIVSVQDEESQRADRTLVNA